MSGTGGYLERPAPSGLADMVEVILDRGLVVDAYARVSALGIELVTFDARIVIASADTYLRFADATNRLEMESKTGRSLFDVAAEGGGEVIEQVAEEVVAKKVEPIAKPVRETVDVVRTGVEKVKDVAEEVEPVAEVVRTGVDKVKDVAEDVLGSDDGDNGSDDRGASDG